MSSCFVPRGFLAFPTPCVPRSHVLLHTSRLSNYLATLEERNRYGAELWRLISSGTLKINIHAEYPFTAEGVRQAHVDLTTGKTTGKLLIKVAN
jgi:NADPH:quinone reductase